MPRTRGTAAWYRRPGVTSPGDEQSPVCNNCVKAKRYCDRRKNVSFRHHKPFEPVHDEEISANEPSVALRDQGIARIFHHYIQNLSHWYDLSDHNASFQKEVPRTALTRPLLFNAIIAFGAIHLSRTTSPSTRAIACTYHDRCVKSLIELLERDADERDGVALAAVCILRSYEILAEESDPNRHLGGAYALATHGRASIHRPMLGKTGFWNYLREDVTYCLMNRCPVKIDLGDFSCASAVSSEDEQLNLATMFIAAAINLTFNPEVFGELAGRHMTKLEGWRQSLPSHFDPYSSTSIDPSCSAFPTIRTLRDCHAATLQYYLAAKTLVKLSQASSQTPTEDINANAIQICGLAFTSNSPAVLVNSFGPISYCCRFLDGEPLRCELIRRLQGARRETGWPVHRIVDDLTSYWRSQRDN